MQLLLVLVSVAPAFGFVDNVRWFALRSVLGRAPACSSSTTALVDAACTVRSAEELSSSVLPACGKVGTHPANPSFSRSKFSVLNNSSYKESTDSGSSRALSERRARLTAVTSCVPYSNAVWTMLVSIQCA